MQNTEILIRRATADDCKLIADIGRVAVELSHRSSCSIEDMNYFLSTHYNEVAILEELNNPEHVYHILFYGGQAAGFSKVILNATHPNITEQNATKLDRIYLLEEFYDLKLGHRLLEYNIALSKGSGQCGMWLFTWMDNERAVNFYKKNGFTIIGNHRFKVSENHYNPNYHMMLQYEM